MKPHQITTATLEDIIFEHRNKAYGAYYLRKTYENRIHQAAITAFFVFALAVSAPVINKFIHGNAETETIIKPHITEINLTALSPKEPLPLPAEPRPPSKPTIKNVLPVIRPDEQVTEEIPQADDFENADPGNKTSDGSDEPVDLHDIEDSGEDIIIGEPDPVLLFVEQDAEFPGGEQALFEYLHQNLLYPQTARENNIEGIVPISFVVNREGRIVNVEVLRDIGGGCGEEAKRVMESMPNWRPAKQNGRSVSVQYSVPIRFSLQ